MRRAEIREREFRSRKDLRRPLRGRVVSTFHRMSPLQGSCLCGGVRFEVTEPFTRVSQCHCEFCKKISGGYGTVSGRARNGRDSRPPGRGASPSYTPEGGSAKTFCSVCGSNLFGGGWPDVELAPVRLSALDRRTIASRRRIRSSARSPRGRSSPRTASRGTTPARPDMAQRIFPMIAYEDAVGRDRLAHRGIRLPASGASASDGRRDDRPCRDSSSTTTS